MLECLCKLYGNKSLPRKWKATYGSSLLHPHSRIKHDKHNPTPGELSTSRELAKGGSHLGTECETWEAKTFQDHMCSLPSPPTEWTGTSRTSTLAPISHHTQFKGLTSSVFFSHHCSHKMCGVCWNQPTLHHQRGVEELSYNTTRS